MKTYYSIQHKLGEPEILVRGITADTDGENPCLWVELIFEQTERKICYELTPDGWQYLTGEDEPERITADLLALWHGPEGDKALDWCLSREFLA